MDAFIATYTHREGGVAPQQPADVAVVMPTIIRPTLRDAVRSVFAQDLPGRIHLLIGIDAPAGDASMIEALCAEIPQNCLLQVFYPGFSTSVRHGGLHPARDGGVLRAVLTYLANARLVAYLDDDNWWAPEHLRLLREALTGDVTWAYTLRWFVHPTSRRSICVDRWESVGPGQGIFNQRMGGFVDPNCLMLDKFACAGAVPFWNHPLPGDPKAMSADRNVFAMLSKHFRYVGIDRPTVFYQIDPEDGLHPTRMQLIGPAYDAAS
jgi:hypothetical protein